MNPAYIIHNRPYNEKKQFLVLFTAQDGTTSLAVSTKSTFHPFIQYDLSQTTKRSKKLNETKNPPLFLVGKRLYCGLYLNELLYLFCKENDSYSALFTQYEKTIRLLANTLPIEPLLRQFELALIEAAGYALLPEHISLPYVTFSLQDGLIGHNSPVSYAISTHELTQMRYAQTSSVNGKHFIRHVLNQLLVRQSKSRFFYDKIQERV